MMRKTCIVKMQNVTKSYTQGQLQVDAVRGVSLDIFKGEFLAFSGPSGSGKTSILNMVGGLDLPSSGSISLEGRNISQLTPAELSLLRRDRVGFVFQAFNLISVFSALENAEFVLYLQGKPPEERKTRALKALSDVGLQGLENRRPDELSGGQQQRVAIARAIAAEPAVVLADEPTANLDSKTTESLLDLMVELNKEKNVTFIFSTHDERVMARASRVVPIRDGQIVDQH